MNLNLQFRDVNSNTLINRKVLLTPIKSPEISASFLTVADTIQLITDSTGVITSSLVSGKYKVDLANPIPSTSFYLNVNETGSYVISSSNPGGYPQTVYFNLIDIIKEPFDVKKVNLTPYINYPLFVYENNFTNETWTDQNAIWDNLEDLWDVGGGVSIISLSTTSSKTDINGSVTFEQVVPGVIQVDCIGKVTTTFFIDVPNWYNTGSNGTSWNAKDLLIVKPAKGIKVKTNNADNSYVLTVSSSDARYAPKYHATSSLESASYSNRSDLSTLSLTASYVLSNNIGGVVKNSLSASWVSSSVKIVNADTASYIKGVYVIGSVLNADTASLATNALNANYALTTNVCNFASFAGEAGIATNATSALYASSSTLAVYATNAGSASYAPGNPSISSSYATTASYACNIVTASYALSASWVETVSNTIHTVYSDYSGTSSYALSASYGLTASYSRLATNSATASYIPHISASWIDAGKLANTILPDTISINQINAQSFSGSFQGNIYGVLSGVASNSITASNADTASYIKNAVSSSYSLTASYINNAVSSSYGLTSSYSVFTHLANTASYSKTASISNLSNQASYLIYNAANGTASLAMTASSLIGLTINTGNITNNHTSSVVIQHTTSSFNAGFFEYFVDSGSNFRAGLIFGGWKNGIINYSQIANTEIGSTSDVNLLLKLSGDNVQLISSSSLYNWNVKASAKYI
jgi:hypothetical protein